MQYLKVYYFSAAQAKQQLCKKQKVIILGGKDAIVDRRMNIFSDKQEKDNFF